MNKRHKKGFTIVELVIVIAVIGVLSAILIPTFAGLINSAKEAADTQMVRNLNTALATDEALNGKHETAYDAIKVANNSGYTVEKLTPTASGHDILWDKKSDRFIIVSGDAIKFHDKTTTPSNNKYDWFKIYKEIPAEAEQTYSIYLTESTETEAKIKGVGFDAGENTGITKITYTGSDTGVEVTIRTTTVNTNLSINAPKDAINHYGKSGEVEITSIADKSYHEYGKTIFMDISSGRVALENKAEVSNIHISKNNSGKFESIILSIDKSVSLPNITRDNVEIGDNGVLVIELQDSTDLNNHNSDYIWLVNQGLMQQIRVSNSNTEVGNKKATDIGVSTNAYLFAREICNTLSVEITPEIEQQIENGTIDSSIIVETGLTNEQKEALITEQLNTAKKNEELENSNLEGCVVSVKNDKGITGYRTLESAVQAMKAGDVLEIIDESCWDSATPVYWNGNFYKTIKEAQNAVNENNSDVAEKIVIYPNSELKGKEENSHGTVFLSSVIILGNGSSVNASWEAALESKVGQELQKDISITIDNLKGSSVWGGRLTTYTVNIELLNCKYAHEICLRSPNKISGITNITVRNCTFVGGAGSASTSIQSKFSGNIIIENCSFEKVSLGINIAHEYGSTGNNVQISNCTFTDCGIFSSGYGFDTNSYGYCAAVRLVSQAPEGQFDKYILSDCKFTYTDNTDKSCDIAIGECRDQNAEGKVVVEINKTAQIFYFVYF